MDLIKKNTIVTGAQPSGEFHLGNYLGAIKNWKTLQNDYECFFFLADLHTITCPYDPSVLKQNVIKTAAQYLACGLNPDTSNIFIQSNVIGHTELAWILGCLTPIGQLYRMTQFKAKSESKDFVGSGLLYYPVLMAADILLYNAHLVPVGEDQKQHLELARDTAMRFNEKYSNTFNVPDPYILETGSRIYSLQEPNKKMSKSDPNTKSTIFIFEPIDSIRKKIKSAVTDSEAKIYFSKEKSGISNLLTILSSLTNKTNDEIAAQYASASYSKLKDDVAEVVIEIVKPLQENYKNLINNKDHILQTLKNGAQSAQKIASNTMSKVYKKTGFINT